MTNDFENVYLGELSESKMSQAYALARLAGEVRDEAAWLARVKRWQNTDDENKKGVIAVDNNDGYIIALLYYCVNNTPDLGRVLEVRDLTVPVMFRNSIIEHFVAMLDQLAGVLSCWTISLPLPFVDTDDKSALSMMAELKGFKKENGGIYRYLPVQKERKLRIVSG